MTYKIANALRLISILVLAVVFFFSYAGLPEQVLVLLDSTGEPTFYITRNIFFYGALAIIVMGNSLLYVLSAILSKSTEPTLSIVSTYLMLLTVTINIFISVALSFIGIVNGRENFDYSNFSPFFYVSEGLFVVWLVSFIIVLWRSKKVV